MYGTFFCTVHKNAESSINTGFFCVRFCRTQPYTPYTHKMCYIVVYSLGMTDRKCQMFNIYGYASIDFVYTKYIQNRLVGKNPTPLMSQTATSQSLSLTMQHISSFLLAKKGGQGGKALASYTIFVGKRQ